MYLNDVRFGDVMESELRKKGEKTMFSYILLQFWLSENPGRGGFDPRVGESANPAYSPRPIATCTKSALAEGDLVGLLFKQRPQCCPPHLTMLRLLTSAH